MHDWWLCKTLKVTSAERNRHHQLHATALGSLWIQSPSPSLQSCKNNNNKNSFYCTSNFFHLVQNCLDGVAPSRMVSVSASVNLPLHHKVQKFSSGTGSPGGPGKRTVKRLWIAVYYVHAAYCYRWSRHVLSVGRSLTIASSAEVAEPIWDVVRDVDLGGPKEPCIRWESSSPHVKGQFWKKRKGRVFI